MKIKIRLYVVTSLLSMIAGLAIIPGQAFALMAWQPVPAEHHHGGHHNRMAAKQFMLSENEGAQAQFWKPDLKSLSMKMDHGRASIKPTGMDNYHALVAKKKIADNIDVAIRYIYMRGKPSGISPSVLTGAVKSGLEIVPAPLPREHRRYNAAHDAVFLLRYEGQPLKKQPVSIATSNGTSLAMTTDRLGAIRVTLPDDFPKTQPGRENNKPAEFILYSEYAVNGKNYRTSLSAPYHVDPAHWQSVELGLAVMSLGFISGMVITRRNKKNNTKI